MRPNPCGALYDLGILAGHPANLTVDGDGVPAVAGGGDVVKGHEDPDAYFSSLAVTEKVATAPPPYARHLKPTPVGVVTMSRKPLALVPMEICSTASRRIT